VLTSALVSVNIVTIRRARLELGLVTVRGFESHSQHPGIQPPRTTQPSHPSVGRCNVYWW